MLKNPNLKKEQAQFNLKESHLRIQIEREVIGRSPIKDEKIWVEKNAAKFAEIFKSRKEEILKLYAQNPETAYQRIKELINDQ